MLVKTGGLGAALLGGLYAFGAFDAYPKTVDGTPEAVMESFADLDIRELPGEPGSTAEAAGGVQPRFQLQRAPGRLEWVVYSGSQVATRMIATFEPVDGGARTKITPYVERGDAPDERVSPAFRSTGTTMGLFQAAIEAEYEEMITPGWAPHCNELRDELFFGAGADAAAGGAPVATGAGQARFEAGLSAIKHLHKFRAEMMAAGCNPDKAPNQGGGFRTVTETMQPQGFAEDPGTTRYEREADPEDFGKPMMVPTGTR